MVLWMRARILAGRGDDSGTCGVMWDGHMELGGYEEEFEAFDQMMRLRPSGSAYGRVAYARELQGNRAGAVDSMRLAADATGAMSAAQADARSSPKSAPWRPNATQAPRSEPAHHPPSQCG